MYKIKIFTIFLFLLFLDFHRLPSGESIRRQNRREILAGDDQIQLPQRLVDRIPTPNVPRRPKSLQEIVFDVDEKRLVLRLSD